ncbi:tonB-system energizer ExbB [Bradyrhizobium sp. STM 3562]|uniref:tonB-system energizer ExbB n=1 Tax=Bradyrhizobium sp. STM 3562 TaxID=578924 RepID=UPI003890B081
MLGIFLVEWSKPQRTCSRRLRSSVIGAIATLAILAQPSSAQDGAGGESTPATVNQGKVRTDTSAPAQVLTQTGRESAAAPTVQAPAATVRASTQVLSAETPGVSIGYSTAGRSQQAASGDMKPMPTFLDEAAEALRQMLTPTQRVDLPHDLSLWGTFLRADTIVKSIMVILVLASFVTWTIWLAKLVELACARSRINRAIEIVRTSKTVDQAIAATMRRGGPAALMLRAAQEEIQVSDAAIAYAGGTGLKERVASVLDRIEAFFGRRMSGGTGVLATIGATAPFVGLFGTVWGIMNAFIGISQAQSTNLAVVAPCIAEALLTTAAGLVAAIPAVIIYNVFARSITGYRHLLRDAATYVERLVSRELDFRFVPSDAGRHGARAIAAE